MQSSRQAWSVHFIRTLVSGGVAQVFDFIIIFCDKATRHGFYQTMYTTTSSTKVLNIWSPCCVQSKFSGFVHSIIFNMRDHSRYHDLLLTQNGVRIALIKLHVKNAKVPNSLLPIRDERCPPPIAASIGGTRYTKQKLHIDK